MRALGNNQYEITNSKTGQKRVVKGEELPAYGLAAPEPPLAQKMAAFFAPETTKTFTEGIPAMLNNQSKLPNAKGNLPQAIKNAASQTGFAAKTILRPSQVLETGLQALIPGGGRAAPSVAKAVINPKKAIGQSLEKKAAAGGNVPKEVLEKILGTPQNPNAALWERAGFKASEAKKLAAEAIKDLYKHSAGDTLEGFGKTAAKTPSYLDILKNRTGAYATSRKGFFEPATIEKAVAKNFGRAYSEILHAGVKGTKNRDKALSLIHKITNASPLLKFGGTAWALDKLFKGGGSAVSSLFNQE